MHKFLFILFLFSLNLLAQTLPKSAVILEKANVTATRQIILWMPNPKKNPRSENDDFYACPDETRGSYYSGIAKISLVDIKTKKIINTLQIEGFEDETLDLPYLIKDKGYYKVSELNKTNDGKPNLLNFNDYNNDGKLHEFILFDKVACIGLGTTLIGYSEMQDKVIQYQTELKIDGKTSNEFWVDNFFGQKVNKQGVWKYEVDYRGRGGALEKYEIRYDKKREMFYGTRTSIFEDDKILEEKERPSR
jgi:hypothetical protein